MTKEEFLHYYYNNGCVDEQDLEQDDWGRTALIVIEYNGKFYRSEVFEKWGVHALDSFTILTQPIVVVPKQVMVTQYIVEEDNV